MFIVYHICEIIWQVIIIISKEIYLIYYRIPYVWCRRVKIHFLHMFYHWMMERMFKIMCYCVIFVHERWFDEVICKSLTKWILVNPCGQPVGNQNAWVLGVVKHPFNLGNEWLYGGVHGEYFQGTSDKWIHKVPAGYEWLCS